MKPIDLKTWVDANRLQLVAKFNRAFGCQIQEWPDFTEAEFAKASVANHRAKTGRRKP